MDTTLKRNSYYIDEINRLAKTDKDLLISMSEGIYHDQIDEVVEEIVARKNVKIVLIAGPSSSGKTTSSHRLGIQLSVNGIVPVTIALSKERVPFPKTIFIPIRARFPGLTRVSQKSSPR